MQLKPNPSEEVGKWVDLYTHSLYTWAFYKTADKAVAEDLVQDTFIVAFQNFSRFEGKSQAKTWLFSILRNKIADYFRKSSKETPVSLSLFFNEKGDWKPEQKPQKWTEEEEVHLLDDHNFRNILYKCLERLPKQAYFCVYSKYLEEKDSTEICQELGIQSTNYWQIMHRAKLQLRKCIESNGIK